VFDFGKLSDNQLEPASVSLSADTQALLFAYLSSFPFRFDWIWDGDTPTDPQWDEIQAAIAHAVYELTHEAGMILHAEIELVADVSSYTLTDLADLPGKDLIIQSYIGGTEVSGEPYLNIRLNGDTGANYDYQWTILQEVVEVTAKYWRTYLSYRGLVANGFAGHTYQSQGIIEINEYKRPDYYRAILVSGRTRYRTFIGSGTYHPSGPVDTVEFWPDSGDMRAGSKFAIYTRG